MKKTTAYARKRARQGLPGDPSVLWSRDYGVWARAIVVRKAYDDEANTQDADAIMANVRFHLQRLLDRLVPAGDVEPHDLMAHVVGVAQIRSLDIGKNSDAQGKQQASDTIQALNEASQGLHRMRARWESSQVWGLDGPAITALKDAVDIYETILRNSTPQQMEHAQTVRLNSLQRMKKP